jgi:hypothetical protein
VFEDLPLDEFGNRIPPITAEIAWAGAPQAVVKDTTFLSGAGWFTSSAVLDSERGFLYFKTSPEGIGRIRTWHGRGPGGAREHWHRLDCVSDRQPGQPLRHSRHHRAVIPQDRRRYAPDRRQRELSSQVSWRPSAPTP